MFKLARLGVAALLGLVLAVTLFVSGAFAQTVNAHHGSTPFIHHVVTQPLNHSSVTCGGCGWGGWDGGWGGWGWDGGW